MSPIDKFNIRVYGIVVQDNKILISHENIDGFQMTKFPGGGLEYGEGLVQGLHREFKEELACDIKTSDHLYTSEEFIRSRFRPEEQVIAVYYQLELWNTPIQYKTTQPTQLGTTNHIRFEWQKLQHGLIEELNFQSDRIALNTLFRKINTTD